MEIRKKFAAGKAGVTKLEVGRGFAAVEGICGRPTAKLIGGGGGISSADNFGGKLFVRGKHRHSSNFGAGPSDAGKFNNRQQSKLRPCLHSNQSSQTFSETTNFSLPREHDERT